MLKTLAEKVEPKHTALLVVDVQNDFASEESPYTKRRLNLPGVQAAVGRMDEFIDKAREAGVQIVYIQTGGKPGDVKSESSMEQSLRNAPGSDPSRGMCEPGTWGWEFYKLQPKDGDWIVPKSTYSAFVRTPLEGMLRDKGIETLLMTGISTNVCVESTARHGFMLDFYTVLVEDCCGYYKENLHIATLENMNDRFGVVASASEVTQAWTPIAVEASV
jgi:ureidoacrylate peracid hydrolase